MQPLLSVNNLSVVFNTENERTEAVKNISFHINKGEIVGLVGESGSGKSVTSLSILQLLPSPPAEFASGEIFFLKGEKSANILKASPRELQAIRGDKIAMIFQEPMTSLNPVMSCGKQVMEALLQHKKISVSEAKRKTISWFEKVKLPEPRKMFDRYPHQLSGGQKQRVMIAMAMCCEPLLLICDEPTTALDVTVQKNILHLIKELQQEQDMGVLFITHDLGVVSELADRVAIMLRGEIVEQASTKEIFRNPQHPYTKALIACRPALHQKGERLPVVSDFLEQKEIIPQNFSPEVTLKEKEVLIDVKNISVSYPVKRNLLGKPTDFFKAVDGLSFQVYKGETLGLVGESGCGKTTLGRTLLRLVEPTNGSIVFNGTDITKFSPKELKQFRKEVQLVFQDPYSSLNPRLTVGSALEEPMKVLKLENAATRKKKIRELLDKVSLPTTAVKRYPHQFSGGQRQRIVIARALSLDPSFLVCDESVSALDVSVQAQVLNLLNDLKKDLGLTMLFISHDLSVVRYMCDRMIVMQAGKIVEAGDAEDVYQHPRSGYTKSLLAAIPKII